MNDVNSVAVLNFRFSNTNASRLMKLHTYSCHYVPCPLPSTVADLDLLLMLGLTMFNVCHLTPFFKHQCSYASETSCNGYLF